MQQQRRQHRDRDRISPVEEPVEPIERSGEGEREPPEERDAQPEEVERGLIARPAQPHRCADQQREEPNRREHEIHRPAARRGRQSDLQRLLRAKAHQRVREACALPAAVLVLDHVRRRVDRITVDGNQHVTALNPRAGVS